MKKIISLICLCFMLSGTLLLAGCGFFEEENVGISISSIKKTNEFEDGSSEITVYFTDEYKDPAIFIVPAGKMGEEGNGITEITSSPSEDGMHTDVTIKFSKEGFEDKVVQIPDGKTITSARTETREDGSYWLLLLHNNDQLAEVELPEFRGITGFTEPIVNEDGSVSFTIQCNGVDDLDITIPAGNGISNVVGRTELDGYYIDVFYTNEKAGKAGDGKDTIRFDKPKDPNSWHVSNNTPDDDLDGVVGDFWFEEDAKIIYSKDETGWHTVIAFNGLGKHQISFNYNYPEDTGLEVPVKRLYDINHGSYLSSTVIPVPEFDGYTFVGWYKNPEISGVTMGAFTDMTPVTDDLYLYAVWEKN